MSTQIKKGDYGITVTVTHTSSETVYYSLNGGPEIALTGNDHVTITASESFKMGDNVMVFIEKTATSRITSADIFEFTVI
jgi:hypothetical protein